MDSTIFFLASLIAAFIIGLTRLFLHLRKLKQRLTFVLEYSTKFSEFATNREFDGETYIWLTGKVHAIQTELGLFGVVDYKPAAASYIIHNYQAIPNLLPEIGRQKTRSWSVPGRNYQDQVSICVDVLVRYIGFLEGCIEETVDEIINPLVWLREGVRFILFFPMSLLHWLGLVGLHTVNKIADSTIAKGFSGLVALLALLALIIEITVSWGEFSKAVIDYLQKVF